MVESELAGTITLMCCQLMVEPLIQFVSEGLVREWSLFVGEYVEAQRK